MSAARASILIVDDEESLRSMLSIVLKHAGYDIDQAESGSTALAKINKNDFALVLSDIRMPDLGGLELLARIKEIDPDLPVILMTAHASTNDAVEAMKLGAEDYIIKPFDNEELKIVIAKSLRRLDAEKEIVVLKERLQSYESMVGRNLEMKKLFKLIDTVARTDSTVLIAGESGTGKELIARAFHNKSRRSSRPFVSINCGALPENLLESELFGHRKGAFTDAFQDKKGLLQEAGGGTVLLDEISEMSPAMQVKLLRVLQERCLRPVGSNEEVKIDIRVIAATNRDLGSLLAKGEFRSDLYYRLNVINIEVPPLRRRRDDIPLLVDHFIRIFNQRFSRNLAGIDDQALALLQSYDWPGNVRELENCIERAVALEQDDRIRASSLAAEIRFNQKKSGPAACEDWRRALENGELKLNDFIDELSRKIIAEALKLSQGNMKKAAAGLGLSYRAMRYLVAKLGGRHDNKN